MTKNNKLLLHVCCGPCATAVIEQLAREYALELYFSNSNIFPETEYALREKASVQLATRLNIPMHIDQYDHGVWQNAIAGLEQEPERGKRCSLCFEMRLRRAAQFAVSQGFTYLSTTLPISPHKDFEQLQTVCAQVSQEYGLISVIERFSYPRSVVLAKEYGLYRQKYCGCEYSQ